MAVGEKFNQIIVHIWHIDMEREDLVSHQGRHIMMFVDPNWDHKGSRYAWEWAQSHLIEKDDNVTFVTVVPRRLMSNLLPTLGAIGSSPSSALEVSVLQEQNRESVEAAHKTLQRYLDESRNLRINASAEVLEQTAMTVGATLAEWANKRKFDQGVVGCRNLGALRRVVLTLAGKGSVSSHLVEHLKCPLVVVKSS